MSAKRVQRKRTKGWRMPENTTYVGRPTKWGNMISFDYDGREKAFRCGEKLYATIEESRIESLRVYRDVIEYRNEAGEMDLEELRGKDLACWCPLDQPCHADILLRLANPRVLHLTLTRKWFDMVASGEKTEEYRAPGKWILSRLEGKEYDRVQFKNGYGDVPMIEVEYLGWGYGTGRPEWGGTGETVAVIQLGKVLKNN